MVPALRCLPFNNLNLAEQKHLWGNYIRCTEVLNCLKAKRKSDVRSIAEISDFPDLSPLNYNKLKLNIQKSRTISKWSYYTIAKG